MADDQKRNDDELSVEELEQAAGGAEAQNFSQCSCNNVSGCGGTTGPIFA